MTSTRREFIKNVGIAVASLAMARCVCPIAGRDGSAEDECDSAPDCVRQCWIEFNFAISCSIPIQPCLVDTGAYPNLAFGFCAAGTERAYYTLDPLGNLRPCNHTPTILGNLLLSEESFADLITTERMREFIEVVPELCDPCALRDTCQGGCKAAAQVCYGSLSAEEPFLRRNRSKARPVIQ